MIPCVGSDSAVLFQALPRLPRCWKVSNNPHTTTTLKDWHDVVRIVEKDEQAIMMEKIEGSAKNFRTMMRDESGHDSESEKL